MKNFRARLIKTLFLILLFSFPASASFIGGSGSSTSVEASSSVAGSVSTSAQSFAGVKTFTDGAAISAGKKISLSATPTNAFVTDDGDGYLKFATANALTIYNTIAATGKYFSFASAAIENNNWDWFYRNNGLTDVGTVNRNVTGNAINSARNYYSVSYRALQGTGITSNVGGTTTANASTNFSISGGGTVSDKYNIGDRVSLSSASGTYATVIGFSSTNLATDAALGNGTSQTINRKRATGFTFHDGADASLDDEDTGLISSAANTLDLQTAGTTRLQVSSTGKIGLNSAANNAAGIATCNGATGVTVNNTNVTADSIILVSYVTFAGAPTVAPFISAITASTSFVIKCTAADTTSTVGYVMVDPF